MKKISTIFALSLLLLSSCNEDSGYGYVRFVFQHNWDNDIIKIDGTTPYTNAAGNIVTFSNLEYIISHLGIYGNSFLTFDDPTNVRYISNDSLYSTMLLTHRIPSGPYQGIHFRFGLNHTDNVSNLFTNPPQKDMFWPENMGGGYHFLKIDGKWRNPGEPTDQGFGLHLGTLKKDCYDTIWNADTIFRVDTIPETFSNYFPVLIPKSFRVEKNEITTVTIIMNVKQWMETPYRWDFNVMSAAIMSREHAMDSLVTNGQNVFR